MHFILSILFNISTFIGLIFYQAFKTRWLIQNSSNLVVKTMTSSPRTFTFYVLIVVFNIICFIVYILIGLPILAFDYIDAFLLFIESKKRDKVLFKFYNVALKDSSIYDRLALNYVSIRKFHGTKANNGAEGAENA